MILTVTPNPCVDKTLHVRDLNVGEKIRSTKCECVAGGKGCNVSRAVKTLGYDTAALVLVGQHTGAHVVDMLEQDDGVQCLPVWVDSPTRTITTVLEKTVHRQTALFEPGSRITDDEAEALMEAFLEVIGQAGVVTFNGTVPDRSIEYIYQDLIDIAKERDVLTILDSHGKEFELGLDAKPYMVKPNLAEAEELLGRSLNTDEARWDAVAAIHERGIELVVLSLGKEGAMVSRGGERLLVTPPEIEEINAVGSGDAFLAGFAIGLCEKRSLEEMATLAVAVGTANAMSWDIGHFTLKEVEDIQAKTTVER